MPHDVPTLYDGLPQDEEVVEGGGEEEAAPIQLTPDMVNAQFALIDAQSAQNGEEKPTKKEWVIGLFPPLNMLYLVYCPSEANFWYWKFGLSDSKENTLTFLLSVSLGYLSHIPEIKAFVTITHQI